MNGTVVDLYPGTHEPLCNVEAEMGLLGAILDSNRAYDKVCDFLRPEHFYDRLHGLIYEACARVIEAGKQANPTTLRHAFDTPDFEGIEAPRYLAELAAASIAPLNAYDYGRLIQNLSALRDFREIGSDMVAVSKRPMPDIDIAGMIETAEQALYRIGEGRTDRGGFRVLGDILPAVLDRAQAAFNGTAKAGLSTGIRAVDTKLGGLKNSDLVIVAARPSMGKTALGTNIGWCLASGAVDDNGEIEEPKSVGFFSLEMSAEQLGHRLLADVANIPSDRIMKGAVNGPEFQKLTEAARRIESAPIWIDDTPNLTVAALRQRARRLKREKGLDLLIVDYIQLMSASEYRGNKVQEIGEITRGLKMIAKELDIPVIALSQLSREVERRDNKRPQLADLRDSGSIEQDADVVMFIYREEYYLSREEPQNSVSDFADWQAQMNACKGQAEIIIAKQRHGPVGTATVAFDAAQTRFRDLEDR